MVRFPPKASFLKVERLYVLEAGAVIDLTNNKTAFFANELELFFVSI